jgi:hypothetical protein
LILIDPLGGNIHNRPQWCRDSESSSVLDIDVPKRVSMNDNGVVLHREALRDSDMHSRCLELPKAMDG